MAATLVTFALAAGGVGPSRPVEHLRRHRYAGPAHGEAARSPTPRPPRSPTSSRGGQNSVSSGIIKTTNGKNWCACPRACGTRASTAAGVQTPTTPRATMSAGALGGVRVHRRRRELTFRNDTKGVGTVMSFRGAPAARPPAARQLSHNHTSAASPPPPPSPPARKIKGGGFPTQNLLTQPYRPVERDRRARHRLPPTSRSWTTATTSSSRAAAGRGASTSSMRRPTSWTGPVGQLTGRRSSLLRRRPLRPQPLDHRAGGPLPLVSRDAGRRTAAPLFVMIDGRAPYTATGRAFVQRLGLSRAAYHVIMHTHRNRTLRPAPRSCPTPRHQIAFPPRGTSSTRPTSPHRRRGDSTTPCVSALIRSSSPAAATSSPTSGTGTVWDDGKTRDTREGPARAARAAAAPPWATRWSCVVLSPPPHPQPPPTPPRPTPAAAHRAPAPGRRQGGTARTAGTTPMGNLPAGGGAFDYVRQSGSRTEPAGQCSR